MLAISTKLRNIVGIAIFSVVLLCLASLCLVGKAQAQAQQDDDYEFGVLFDAPGVSETYYNCIACHSEKIVAQQGQTRKGWIKLLEWMVEEQGMPVIEEPDYTTIIDYLSTNYNTDRPNFPRPKR